MNTSQQGKIGWKQTELKRNLIYRSHEMIIGLAIVNAFNWYVGILDKAFDEIGEAEDWEKFKAFVKDQWTR